MKTGEIIKDLRVKKGLTQEELADKTELSVRTIQRIENGEVDPRSFTLQMIAKALDVDFSIFNGPEFDNSVETQKEDVPFDMICHVDSEGNTYDFGFGMNWNGIIKDARVEKYKKAVK